MTARLLTVTEVSEILRVKPARVYELTREKKLPAILLGERQYRWSENAIGNYILFGGNQEKSEVQNDSKS